MTTRLSEHFTLEELCHSDTAKSLGIDNTPTPAHLANLKHLAERLEEVRALFGRPVTIESGYRNPEVNARVGGVADSDHAQGHAADIQVDGITDLEVAKRIRDSGIKFDQLIREDGRTVHISFSPRMRGHVLRQPGGPGSIVHVGLE
jgi:putative chitinase